MLYILGYLIAGIISAVIARLYILEEKMSLFELWFIVVSWPVLAVLGLIQILDKTKI